MEVEVLQNVLVAAYRSPWVGGIDPARAPRHAKIVQAGKVKEVFPTNDVNSTLIYLKGNYFYGGALYFHFGHILQDTIIRLWGYDRNKHTKIIFLLVGAKRSIPNYFFDILDYLDISKSDCVFVYQDCVVEALEVCEPGNMAQETPKPEYLQWLKVFQSNMQINEERYPKKIFLGRVHIQDKGSFMGESFFSNLLLKNDFVYVKPELMSLEEQMKYLINAEQIVFTEGSSIFSLALLSYIKASVYMLSRRSNSHILFEKWILPRVGEFKIIGNSGVQRLGNLNGENKPNSPSFLLNPLLMFDELKSHMLLPRDSVFDKSLFKFDELNDTQKYFNGDLSIALSRINSLDRAYDV